MNGDITIRSFAYNRSSSIAIEYRPADKNVPVNKSRLVLISIFASAMGF